LGRVEFILGNTSEALRLLKLSAEANPKDARAYALLAAIYALSGRREESSWALANAVRLQPEITINSLFNDWSVPLEATSNLYRQQHERFRSGLQLAGMRD
jgi:predicted Zn-dependent protease